LAAIPDIGRAVNIEAPATPAVESARGLFEQYSDQIFRFCYQQLGSREEAEDAVQSTFLNAFRGLGRGVVPESESAWLYKIAHNVCLARRRARWRRGRVETPGDLQALAEVIAAPQGVEGERLVRLEEALRSMPRSQRQAILLREWQGLSYREIGERLELSQAAVETLLFRARRSLASALEPVERRSRIRAAFDLSSLLGTLKGLFGGGVAVKTAAVVAVAVTSAGLVVAVEGGIGRADPVDPVRASPPAAVVVSTDAPGLSRAERVDATRPQAIGTASNGPSEVRSQPSRGTGVGPAGAAAGVTEVVKGDTPAGTTPGTGVAGGSAESPSVAAVDPPGKSGATPPNRPDGSPGSSELAPGHTGAAPGKSGLTPADGALPPGQSGAAPGKSGETPGQLEKADDPPPTPSAADAKDKEKDKGKDAPEYVPLPAEPAPPAPESVPPGQAKKAGQ
jgi:RNA polymerase sigma-70 factor (ECF subfamily)